MQTRRAALATLGGTILGSAAGCLELLQDGVEATAEPAAVEESAVSEQGFEFETAEAYEIHETVEVGDQSRELQITSWGTGYTRGLADVDVETDGELDRVEDEIENAFDQEGAGFAIISTPSQSIAGQEVNPVAIMDDETVIEEFNDELVDGSVDEIAEDGSREVDVLDDSITTNFFVATVETDNGTEVDVRLHITEVENEDDILIAIGVYPVAIDMEDEIHALTEGIEHPVDPDRYGHEA